MTEFSRLVRLDGTPTRRFRGFVWGVAILCGLFQAGAYRQQMGPDGISYLDMATAFSHGEWKALIHAYWSPVYPGLLGLALAVIRPSATWESPVVHLVNFLIYLGGLTCFEFLVKYLIHWQRSKRPDQDKASLPEWAWWGIGYALFLWGSLHLISLTVVTPDLAVAAVVYLASGLLLRIAAGTNGWFQFVALGGILALGYYVKTVMFPLAFVFLGVSIFLVPGFRRGVARGAASLFVFALIAGPYIGAISRAVGRLTFGESGRITYARFVTFGETAFWQGQDGPPDTGTLKHPLRKIFDNPPVQEFVGPVGGTYPFWYDPSYWFDGLKPRFNLSRQLDVIRHSLDAYFNTFLQLSWLLVGFLALALSDPTPQRCLKRLVKGWVLWLPPLAALVLYGVVNVEDRLIGGFVVLVCVGLFHGLPLAQPSERLTRSIVLAMVAVVAVEISWWSARHIVRIVLNPPSVELEIAQAARGIGLQPGDKVSYIGYPYGAYWAHLDQVRIVAEIPYPMGVMFWTAKPQVQDQVIEKFAAAGSRAIVADDLGHVTPPPGWQRMGDTDHYIYVLSK